MSRDPHTEVGSGGGDYEQEDSPRTSPPVYGDRPEGISIPYSVADGRMGEADPGNRVLSDEIPGARLIYGHDPRLADHVRPAGPKKTYAAPEWAATTQPGLPKPPEEPTRAPLSSVNSPTKGGDDDACCDPGVADLMPTFVSVGAQECDDVLDDEGIVGAADWLQSTLDMLDREDPGES